MDKHLYSNLKNKYKRKEDKNLFDLIGLFQDLPEHPSCAFLEHDDGIDCSEAPEKESEMSARKYASKKKKRSSKCDGKKKARKNASFTNFTPISIPMQMEDMTQAKESENSSGKYASEELPMTLKCDGEKKNVQERENDIEHSVLEKTQNINQTEPVNEIHSENPAKSKDAADEPEGVSMAGYDIENLPKGWDRRIIIRKTGKTAGQLDIYFYSPDGIKLRSRRDIAAYLARTKSDVKIEDFDFSRKSISSHCAVKLIQSEEETAPAKLKNTLGKRMS